MIIKSHIRGGYRAAADYMKDIGKNEKTRIVEIKAQDAQNLDEAFKKMWETASCTKCTKPLHHISINPMKGERLTDKQVQTIANRCAEVYGYKPHHHHQRVIVEHIKDGRQHFHVIFNRVSLVTGKTVWPGHHWKKSKQVAREMESLLGLKRPELRRGKTAKNRKTSGARTKSVITTRTTTKTVNRPSSNNKPKTPIFIQTRTTPNKKTSTTTEPIRPALPNKQRWPELAILDWKEWGHKFPRRFFVKWPELENV